MPTYRSINIALHSQFDIEALPECYPSASPLTTGLKHPAIASLINDATATCSVYVPVLPGSQFWIAYSVSPPVPEEHYFLFKLFINGENIVSWSTGKENRWTGKTMFGLFDAGNGKTAEKRVLCFSAPDQRCRVTDGAVEIRVHRASGRKRIEREMDVYDEMRHSKENGGISLVNAGRAGPEQPKRFYKFALIDPVDQPFATFLYYYRTWQQLRELGLLNYGDAESDRDDFSVIEPEDSSTHSSSSEDGEGSIGIVHNAPEEILHHYDDSVSVHDGTTGPYTLRSKYINNRTLNLLEPSIDLDHAASHKDRIPSGTYIPRGAPSEVSTGSPHSLRRCGRLDSYRLSMPPAIKFDLPQQSSCSLPLPQKTDLTSSTAYRPHPAYPVEEWTVRTPSPGRSLSDDISSPTLETRRDLGISGASLVGGLLSTWKRSVSSTQSMLKADVDEGVRSVSY